MFDDPHPGLVAGLCGAIISIFLNIIFRGISVVWKRYQVVQSRKVLNDRWRPVFDRMEDSERMMHYKQMGKPVNFQWTKELDEADSITTVSWYNVFNLLKLNKIINSPTSDIHSTMVVARLVAAQAAAQAAEQAAQAAEQAAQAAQAAAHAAHAAHAAVDEVKERVSVLRHRQQVWSPVHFASPHMSPPEEEEEKPKGAKEEENPKGAKEEENPKEEKKPLKYFDEKEEPPQMYFEGHQARRKQDYVRIKKGSDIKKGAEHQARRRQDYAKMKKGNEMEKGDSKGQEGKFFLEENKKEEEPYKEKSSQENKKERCQEEEMLHHPHHREEEEARKEENEEKTAPYEKECKNLLSSSEDPLHTISPSHQEEIHPQGLPRRRRRGGDIREHGHGNEADASAHTHFP